MPVSYGDSATVWLSCPLYMFLEMTVIFYARKLPAITKKCYLCIKKKELFESMIVNISEIHPTLGFTEFDILEKYRKSFNESELGKLHSVFPFECMAKAAGLSDRRLGRRNRFSPSAKIALMVLKAYTGFSDRQLVEHLNGNIHYQIFCGIMIPPSLPITNFKIVSAIRNEIASRLDIDSFGHKASAQQIQECGGILSVLLQEKKEESFKDKNA